MGQKNQPYSKFIDKHCRNHGGRRHQWECAWCFGNRMNKNIAKEKLAKQEIKDFMTGNTV